MASDAFFPFRDATDVLIKAGVSAIIQPGGSVRDQESIGEFIRCEEGLTTLVRLGLLAFTKVKQRADNRCARSSQDSADSISSPDARSGVSGSAPAAAVV